MKVSYVVRAYFRFPEGTKIELNKTLEVALDCQICKLTHRTIIIYESEDKSFCPYGKHKFPAVIKKISTENVGGLTEIKYYLDYDYVEFEDISNKYEYARGKSRMGPQWARISFTVTCPRCGRKCNCSTQNNLVRPFKSYCDCDTLLFEDTEEMPIFERIK